MGACAYSISCQQKPPENHCRPRSRLAYDSSGQNTVGKSATTTCKTLNQGHGLNPTESSRHSLGPQPAVLTVQWRHLGGGGWGSTTPQGFMMLIFPM